MGESTTPTYDPVTMSAENQPADLASFKSADLLPSQSYQPMDQKPPAPPPKSSSGESDAGSFVFDNADQAAEQATEPTSTTLDEPGSYDLRPPPPAVSISNAERLAASLFSVDHLNLILSDQGLAHNFAVFLNTYLPRLNSVLVQYQETQKAVAAVHYANCLAERAFADVLHVGPEAAVLDNEFEKEFQRLAEELVSDGLSAYITYKLVQVVTECLVKEITGKQVPFMRGLAEGIAEVYCMTDPNIPDNPIVYASEGNPGFNLLFMSA